MFSFMPTVEEAVLMTICLMALGLFGLAFWPGKDEDNDEEK